MYRIQVQNAARRGSPVSPPTSRPLYAIYSSDGASRRQPGRDISEASCGNILHIHVEVQATRGTYLGDFNKNESEYEGVLRSLGHELGSAYEWVCIRVDSLIVARQLQGKWSGRAAHLIPLCARSLELLAALRRR